MAHQAPDIGVKMKRVTKPKAEAMGYQAFKDHKAKSSNPFTDGQLEAANAWDTGWDRGYKESPLGSMEYEKSTGMWIYSND
jgi:ribosome modulation factor